MSQLRKIAIIGAGLGLGHHLAAQLAGRMDDKPLPPRLTQPQTDADCRALEAAQAKRKRREEKLREIGGDA